MTADLAVIGIDSLDPALLVRYREHLPAFDRLLRASPTLTAGTAFPNDTVPAWVSMYTGLDPCQHGFLYTYDVFDQQLDGIRQLDTGRLRGMTFWDRAGSAGRHCTVLFPMLIYPAWPVRGTMVCRSPLVRPVDRFRVDAPVDVTPAEARGRYAIPDHMAGLSGGFPGRDQLAAWARQGEEILARESALAMDLFRADDWDLFFAYFSLLDIVQHRLWRFTDPSDPLYPGENPHAGEILRWYQLFDRIVAGFLEERPDIPYIVASDHGHRSRPYRTVQVNELLRRRGYLRTPRAVGWIRSRVREVLLTLADRLDLEEGLIRFAGRCRWFAGQARRTYAPGTGDPWGRSTARLSPFAGIKSYPHGGIELNRDLLGPSEIPRVRDAILADLNALLLEDGRPAFRRVCTREDLCGSGRAGGSYPDILFLLQDDRGVGWGLHGGLYGRARDHKVASGGHGPDAVFLLMNTHREVRSPRVRITDLHPTVLDLLDAGDGGPDLHGRSILQPRAH